jgi:hypothetical protein
VPADQASDLRHEVVHDAARQMLMDNSPPTLVL